MIASLTIVKLGMYEHQQPAASSQMKRQRSCVINCMRVQRLARTQTHTMYKHFQLRLKQLLLLRDRQPYLASTYLLYRPPSISITITYHGGKKYCRQHGGSIATTTTTTSQVSSSEARQVVGSVECMQMQVDYEVLYFCRWLLAQYTFCLPFTFLYLYIYS